MWDYFKAIFGITMLAVALILITGFGSAAVAQAHPHQPIASVKKFADSLPSKLKRELFINFGHSERFNFGWVPGTRRGVGLNELNTQQRNLLGDVLRSVLSPEGFKKIEDVLIAEEALGKMEGAPDYRDPKKYWLAVFGKPTPEKKWGLRFEGHHLSLNLTLKGDEIISATPTFIGSNPARIPSGRHKGLRPMAREIDSAWALFQSLSPQQRRKARTGGGLFGGLKSLAGTKSYDIGYPDGLSFLEMTDQQQRKLLAIITAYVSTMPKEFVKKFFAGLRRREFNEMRFHWSGAEQPGDSYLFRIQGQRILIEHDAHDGGMHIHSIWRDKRHDFGLNKRRQYR